MFRNNEVETLSSIGSRRALACLALVLPLSVGTVSAAQNEHDHASQAGQQAGASMQMHQNMMGGMKDMMGMKPSGDMDHDFAMMMRKHHAMGVQMAEREVQNGKDPQMRAMAQKIVDSQKKEIAEFDEWLRSHKPSTSGSQPSSR